MLCSTFCHIPGVGLKTERSLWQAGILDWGAALHDDAAPQLYSRGGSLRPFVRESIARLEDQDVRYFQDRLPAREHWRLFPQFRHTMAYLDIETTGLGNAGDYITSIAVYDGLSIRTYVHGQNMDQFGPDIAPYRVLVTYNGKCFDIPFIRSSLGLTMDQAHIDLRYVLASVGYRGGLKGCEKKLGIDRGDLVDVDGYFAVLLWQDYVQRGNPHALDTLLAYNVLDAVNLETLMVMAYNLKLQNTPFEESYPLPLPVRPANPFQTHMATIYRLRLAYVYR